MEARYEARLAPQATEACDGSHAIGQVIVLGPDDAFVSGEIDIRRAGAQMGVYGNPLIMRAESERDAVVDGYGDLLRGSQTAGQIAHARRLAAPHAACARVLLHRRLHALSRLAERVRNGETLRLRCGCKPRRCHGDVIAAWICERCDGPE